MAKSAQQKTTPPQRSRKSAMAGQLSPAQRAQASVGSTMSRLDSMMAQMRNPEGADEATEAPDAGTEASSSNGVEASTPQPEQTEAPKAAESSGVPKTVTSLEELRDLIESAEDSVFAKVPLNFIRGSMGNHRLLAIPFATFLKHLPPCPENWRALSAEEYVDTYWEEPLRQLMDEGALDEHGLRKAREQLATQFEIGQSVQDSRQIHPPSGYLKFDPSGDPSYVELTSGEQRIRGYYMVGRAYALMDFPSDAAVRREEPVLMYARQRLRVAENMKSTGLSIAERLSALNHLMHSLVEVKGAATVAGMSNGELREEFKTAITLSRAHSNRFFKVVRHPQCPLLIELCDRFDLGIAKINDLTSQATALSDTFERDTTAADVWATALMDDELPAQFNDVPSALRNEVTGLLQHLVDHRSPGATLAQRALTEAEDMGDKVTDGVPGKAEEAADSEAGVEVPPEDTTSAPNATAAGVKPLPQVPGRYAEQSRRARMNKSPNHVRLQKTMGWSVSKGPSNAEAHRNLYTNALLLVTLLEAPNVPKHRVEQLRELLRLQGIPSEIENFRAALAELVDSYQLPFEVLNRSHLESQDLLDRLADSEDSVKTIRQYLAEKSPEESAS